MKSGILNNWIGEVSVEKEFLAQQMLEDIDILSREEILRFIIEHYLSDVEVKQIIGDFYPGNEVELFCLDEMIGNGCVELDFTSDDSGKALFYCEEFENIKSQEEYESLNEKEQIEFQTKAIEVFTPEVYKRIKHLLLFSNKCLSTWDRSKDGKTYSVVYLLSKIIFDLNSDLENVVFRFL